MAITNGTCVSICNQPKTQFCYISRVTPVCRCFHPFCGWRLPQESLGHILASPGYAPVTIAVNVTWMNPMKRGFNACQTYRSMYPYIFNRFPVIQPVSSKVRNFSTFWLPWVCPWDNRGNVTWLERGFNFNVNRQHKKIIH